MIYCRPSAGFKETGRKAHGLRESRWETAGRGASLGSKSVGGMGAHSTCVYLHTQIENTYSPSLG